MKIFIIYFLFQNILTAAIVYRATDIRIGTATGLPFGTDTIDLDVNQDSQIDWSLNVQFSGSSGSTVLFITTPDATQFVYRTPASILLNELVPFGEGEIIGPALADPDYRFMNTLEAFGAAISGSSASSEPGDDPGPFFGKTAYLGFQFEIAQNTHYGYALLEDDNGTGATISALAWNSQPNSPIRAGAIPEPSAALLSLAAIRPLMFRRRKKSSARLVQPTYI